MRVPNIVPKVLCAAAIVALLISWSAPARACSCVQPTLKRTVVPEHGAKGVPTDARVRVFLRAFPDALRPKLASEYRLKAASGQIVPMRGTVVRTRLDLVPDKSLQPKTKHVLEQLFVYDDQGLRLTDDERLNQESGPRHTAWFPVAAFETGAGPDARTPVAPGVQSAAIHFAQGGGDCGPGAALSTEHATAGMRSDDAVEIEVRGQGVVDTYPADPHSGVSRGYAGNMLCSFDPFQLRQASPLQVRVVVRSLSNVVSSGPWVAATAEAGAWPRGAAGHGYGVGIGGWSSGQVELAPKALTSNPPLWCPHGLQLRASSLATVGGAPWTYEDLGVVGWSGGHGWTAVTDDATKTASLIRFDAAGVITPLPSGPKGIGPRGWFGPEGIFIVTTNWRAAFQSSIGVTRVDRNGRSMWSKTLGATGGHTAPRVVAGEKELLVVWERLDEAWLRSGKRQSLAWATLAADSGRVVHQDAEGLHEIADGYPAVAHIRGRFVVAHHRGQRSITLEFFSIDRKGRASAPKPIALGSTSGGVDLARGGYDDLGLVTERSGHIVWALLGPNGRVRRGPKVVSEGLGQDNRKPRIAFGHGMFVVVWERHPIGTTHAALVDRLGNVSPVMDLAAGAESSTPGVAVTPDGFVASVSLERERLDIELLRCAPARWGAPQRIERTWTP